MPKKMKIKNYLLLGLAISIFSVSTVLQQQSLFPLYVVPPVEKS